MEKENCFAKREEIHAPCIRKEPGMSQIGRWGKRHDSRSPNPYPRFNIPQSLKPMSLKHHLKRLVSGSPVRIWQSVLSVVEDAAFERRYRLDTQSEVAIADLDISEQDKQHADKYKPTRARYFRKLMQQIDVPRDGTFVDVGCGKGRVLLLAAEQGFGDVVGLEISQSLTEIARRNVEVFRSRHRECGDIEVICTNILDYEMDGDENVFFLYSPFDEPVTAKFLDLIRDSVRTHPRDLWLIIDEFRFPNLLAGDSVFGTPSFYKYGSAEFHIYRHQPSVEPKPELTTEL